VHHVAGFQERQVVGRERQLLQARQPRQQPDDAVAAVVAVADGDAARVEENEQRVEGRQPRGVGQG